MCSEEIYSPVIDTFLFASVFLSLPGKDYYLSNSVLSNLKFSVIYYLLLLGLKLQRLCKLLYMCYL